jgi:hypothetical protein
MSDIQFRGFSKPWLEPSGSIIHQKDSQNSAKAMMLKTAAYYRERTWSRMCSGRSSEDRGLCKKRVSVEPRVLVPCSVLWLCTAHGVLPSREACLSSVSRVLVGLCQISMISWMPCGESVSRLTDPHPQSPCWSFCSGQAFSDSAQVWPAPHTSSLIIGLSSVTQGPRQTKALFLGPEPKVHFQKPGGEAGLSLWARASPLQGPYWQISQ